MESGGDSESKAWNCFLCIRPAENKFIVCDVSWFHMFISSGGSASQPQHSPHDLCLKKKEVWKLNYANRKKGEKVSICRCLLSSWFGWFLSLQHAELLLV